MRHPGDERGFTLLEVLFVTAIIAVLVGIVILTYSFSLGKSRAIACLSSQRVFLEAVFMYQDAHGGDRPDAIEDLEPYVAGFDTAVTCPADGSTHLRYDPIDNNIVCDIHE